jgi:hypothetical protein
MYKAILNVRLEVHEVNKEGECTGNTLSPAELNKAGIKTAFLADISGVTKNDCLTKLKEAVNDLLSN